MPPKQPWFRLYSEVLNDRKLEHVARATKQPKYCILGIWTGLLALANDSPVRGSLFLTEEIPLTIDDISRELEIEKEQLEIILAEFQRLEMLDLEGVYNIANWNGRQFASDSSTERVREWRKEQKEKEEAEETNQDNDENDQNSGTLQQCFGNTPDTKTETETETEKDTLGANAPPKPPPEPEKTKRKPTAKQLRQAELCEHFSELTAIPVPENYPERNKRWWQPLNALAALCDDDIERTKSLIAWAVSDMDQGGLTISSPQSIKQVAIAEQGRRKRGVVRTTKGKPTNSELTVAAGMRLLNQIKGEDGKAWQH